MTISKHAMDGYRRPDRLRQQGGVHRHKVNTSMADLIAAQNGYSVEDVGRMLLLTRRRRR